VNRPRIAVCRSRVAYLLLALALLLGQAAAYAHVCSHLKSATDASDFDSTTRQLCSECLSSAPLLSAAGSPHAPFIAFVAVAATPIITPAVTHVEAPRHYAFRQRAPPELR
jgi:hypothetical protein